MKSSDKSYLLNVLKNCDIHEDTVQDLAENFHYVSFKKNQYVHRKDMLGKSIFFIQKGIMRHFYAENEKDFTTWFSKEGDFVVNASFFTQKPIHEIIQTLESVKAFSLSYDVFESLCSSHHDLEHYFRNVLAEQLYLVDQYYAESYFFNATQRYQNFLKQFPDILLRVPLHHIASFLNMSPETLSRIRSNCRFF